MNWLDPLLVIILLLLAVSGFGRGLAKSIFDITGYFVLFVLALFASRYLSGPLANLVWPDSILYSPEIIEILGIDIPSEQIPVLVMGAISLLVLFIIFSVGFRVFSGSFSWVNRIPVFGLLNRIGGGAVGVLLGALFGYFIIVAFSLVPFSFFMNALNNSLLARYAFEHVLPYGQWLKDFLIRFYVG